LTSQHRRPKRALSVRREAAPARNPPPAPGSCMIARIHPWPPHSGPFIFWTKPKQTEALRERRCPSRPVRPALFSPVTVIGQRIRFGPCGRVAILWEGDWNIISCEFPWIIVTFCFIFWPRREDDENVWNACSLCRPSLCKLEVVFPGSVGSSGWGIVFVHDESDT